MSLSPTDLLSSIILGWLFAMAIGHVLEAVFDRGTDPREEELDS